MPNRTLMTSSINPNFLKAGIQIKLKELGRRKMEDLDPTNFPVPPLVIK